MFRSRTSRSATTCPSCTSSPRSTGAGRPGAWAAIGAPCTGACADVPSALTDPIAVDGDLDGWTDPEELLVGLDPTDADSDDDGLPDGSESLADLVERWQAAEIDDTPSELFPEFN